MFKNNMLLSKIYFVRHAESIYNFLGKHNGSGSDTELTEKGIEQAFAKGKFLAEKFPNISQIFASNMKRAVQTAKEINKSLDLDIILDSELREKSYGDLEGVDMETFIDVSQRFPDGHDFIADFGGESIADIQARVKDTLCRYFTSGFEEILLVSHGRFGKEAQKIFMGIDQVLDNVDHIIFDPNELKVTEICGLINLGKVDL